MQLFSSCVCHFVYVSCKYKVPIKQHMWEYHKIKNLKQSLNYIVLGNEFKAVCLYQTQLFLGIIDIIN